MKKLIFACLSVAWSISLFAQYPETKVSSTIREVVVFPQGAQEFRTAAFKVDKGFQTLRFQKLPDDISLEQTQMKGLGKFTLLSITVERAFLKEEEYYDPQLRDSIEILEYELSLLQNNIAILEEERGMFQSNRKIVGDSGLILDNMLDIGDFYAERIREIEFMIIDLRKEELKLNEQLSKLKNQESQFIKANKQSYNELVVSILSDEKADASVEITCFTKKAGWVPYYDLRAKDTQSPVRIDYKSQVFQYTGNNWDNVKLTLSTRQPSLDGSLPSVHPWEVYFAQDINDQYKNQGYGNIAGKQNAFQQQTYSWNTQQLNTMSSAEFEIKSKYSIPSDSKPYVVGIAEHEFQAVYQYATAPKIAEEAFLQAGITNWYNFGLIPATANIYFKGTYVGKTFLQTETTLDTLMLSLGVDESVVVKRKKNEDLQSKTVTGNSKKQTDEFEISIRNTRTEKIRIVVEDQIPVTSQKEISIDVEEISKADYNKELGKLIWKLDVSPGETKSVKLRYTVKYPKEYIVPNL